MELSLNSLGLQLEWIPHPGREDALGLAYNPHVFQVVERATRGYPPDSPKVASGRIDLCHIPTNGFVRAGPPLFSRLVWMERKSSKGGILIPNRRLAL